MAAVGTLVMSSGLMLAGSTSANAEDQGNQVCRGLDSGKIDVNGQRTSVTVTAPEGQLITGYCVKAGSTEQGDGPKYVTLASPQKTVTLSYQTTAGETRALSHYSLSYTSTAGSNQQQVTPTVEFRNPTCEVKTAGWAGFVGGIADSANDGVSFAVTGQVAPGKRVTVTATAEAGYHFGGGTTTKTFTHTFSKVPSNCEVTGGNNVVVAPTVDFRNPTCELKTAGWAGFVGGVADSANDGVTFAVTGQVAPGKHVTVTATAQTGYQFAGGATTKSFTHTFGDVPTNCQAGGGPGSPGQGGISTGGQGPGQGSVKGVGQVAGQAGNAQAGAQAGAGQGAAGVLGAQSSVPTVVTAGLTAETHTGMAQTLAQWAVAAGLALLLLSAWTAFGRRTPAMHKA